MSEFSKAQQQTLQQEIATQKLPLDFIDVVTTYYLPLAQRIIEKAEQLGHEKINDEGYFFLGVQGTQGSGKSTCASFLKLIFETVYSKQTLVASIDDFYLTRAERQQLAQSKHPLFVTRGVPGTHDIKLLEDVLDQCAKLSNGESVKVPTFDKATDDRAPAAQWQIVKQPIDIMILEGWCVGLSPQQEQALTPAINTLEADEDADAIWRKFANQQLAGPYANLYGRFDGLVALQAPNFECVFDWRLLQEKKLEQKLSEQSMDTSNLQSEAELKRFISHYERLTKHALRTMPEQADWLLMLQQEHGFSELISRT
ncbi:MAG: hypothetical protein KTR16_11025 [Acidiferrobacterales bacterium]|nr:hypothetical protein [Acidiferrobacterales bacterium]